MADQLQIDFTPVVAALEHRLDELERALSPLIEERRFVSIAEAAAQLNLHECTVRRAIRRCEFETRRVGRRVLVALPTPAKK
jgi:excisionase family DNA binding protein